MGGDKMSKVMIEGMEMPKSCYQCRFMLNFGFCAAKKNWILAGTRMDKEVSLDCPLQEVKE